VVLDQDLKPLGAGRDYLAPTCKNVRLCTWKGRMAKRRDVLRSGRPGQNAAAQLNEFRDQVVRIITGDGSRINFRGE